MFRLERNLIIFFFLLKKPVRSFFGVYLSHLFRASYGFVLIIFMESSVYIEKENAIILFFIQLDIFIYTDI